MQHANTSVLRMLSAFSLAFVVAGCGGSSNGTAPPGTAQVERQTSDMMNDPHVPDSVKQHLQAQQDARRQASSAYAAALRQKSAQR